MSSSERSRTGGELLAVLEELHGYVDTVFVPGASPQDITPDVLSRLIADAARLYAAVCAAAGREVGIESQAVSATEAIMIITALMESQNLNTFDLAVWQSPSSRSTSPERQ